MTETMKTAMMAVNKFLFFSWNYTAIDYKWKGCDGVVKCLYVPEFLAEIKWTFPFDHALEKWKQAVECDEPVAYLPKFYSYLDGENRKRLLAWVMENYNDEKTLIDDED